MTEEEMIANEMSDTCKEVISLIEQEVLKARKEKCFEQNKDGTIKPCEVMKENITLVKENVKLKEEKEKLKNDYKKQRNRRIDELQKDNADLKEQIEKMKCCGNCKHYFKKKQRCFLYEMYSKEKKECLKNHNKWELAE